ncbi:uncharacterized protein MKK02DRAFT_40050 [Dioszegia hungarica]|uniref:Uncharacterized protein n=1 Tax=Dioszegia hungarica TaxID=4972 RepID=A0AA38HFV5_9TREE|nr:uncharacterized protein MKK02DRAFT_40050 [Dioszegia hungarica]KAI9639725.1 hypothetical protein MKK02DRAFT_40050 [Dioszegia hungarica]
MPTKKHTLSNDSDDEVATKKVKKASTATPVKWTPEEEAIFAELAEGILKKHLWDAVKADGRLVHRKANGIYMRIGTMVKKMIKS